MTLFTSNILLFFLSQLMCFIIFNLKEKYFSILYVISLMNNNSQWFYVNNLIITLSNCQSSCHCHMLSFNSIFFNKKDTSKKKIGKYFHYIFYLIFTKVYKIFTQILGFIKDLVFVFVNYNPKNIMIEYESLYNMFSFFPHFIIRTGDILISKYVCQSCTFISCTSSSCNEGEWTWTETETNYS